MAPICGSQATAVSSKGEATAQSVPQKMTMPVADARMSVGKDSSQKIIATEYPKVPDLIECGWLGLGQATMLLPAANLSSIHVRDQHAGEEQGRHVLAQNDT